jgi:hypothetical protein
VLVAELERCATRSGIVLGLPTLPRRPSVATPSKKGEFCTTLLSKFPFHEMGNLDRSVVLISGNGIISTLSINFFIEKHKK